MVLETGKREKVWTGLNSVWGKNHPQSQPASKLGVKTSQNHTRKGVFSPQCSVRLRHEDRWKYRGRKVNCTGGGRTPVSAAVTEPKVRQGAVDTCCISPQGRGTRTSPGSSPDALITSGDPGERTGSLLRQDPPAGSPCLVQAGKLKVWEEGTG